MANIIQIPDAPSEALFPIFPSGLTPLGQRAADAEQVDCGHDVEFRSLRSQSVLNRSVSKRLRWVVWSINPYRGCEFACRYCYARYTHEFLERAGETGGLRAPEAFERQIFLKENAPWLLEQELRKLARQGRLHEEIALGTATDPWQPIERRTGLTRSLLEVLSRRPGLRIGVVTKSTLITRDVDLLQRIHERSTLVIHLTITTPDAELARKLEPRAPRPDLRLETVRKLSEAGLRVGVLNSPLLPGITDSAGAIDRMAELAASAGAHFFAGGPLFLKSCSRPTWFEFIRAHFPQLQVEYLERFRNMDFADRRYRERLEALVKASCARHGLSERRTDSLLTRDTGEPASRTAGVKKPVRHHGEWEQARLFG